MKRNHPRVNQVSDVMLSSWRGNCDVQVFVYESNPSSPQYDEIARVTDYTVGYACKGGQKLKDEKEQLVGLTNLYCEQTIDGNIRSLSNKLLNRAASSRFISKPECMVLLLNLDLVKCTDRFETININGKIRLTKTGTATSNNFLKNYEKRKKHKKMTFHEYFHETRNKKSGDTGHWIIPHYTGANVKPVFPITSDYARFIATAHKAWTGRPNFSIMHWEDQYNDYILGGECPTTAKIAHDQAVERFVNVALDATPTTKDPVRNEDMDPEMEAFLDLVGMRVIDELDDPNDIIFNYGIKHDWLSGNKIRENTPDGKSWLEKEIKKHNESNYGELDLPKWIDSRGTVHDYEIDDLTDDQKDIMAYILNGIKKWLNSDEDFTGIRMIINGKGGTGKTVLLKTITSVVRRMFQSKTSVVVSGPTGACSCHAGGKTDHSTFGLNSRNVNETNVSESTKKRLLPEFQDTIVFLFDERSMRESKVIGRMELTARNCAHGGNKTQTPWGGVPIVIQLGDDHQLPSYGKGVFFIPLPGCGRFKPPLENNRNILRGHQIHLDFAKCVMELPIIKRQKKEEAAMKDRLERTRNDNLHKEDIELFTKLHINNPLIDKEIMKEKKFKALYVFANRAPRDEHNLLQLKIVSDTMGQPVALIKAHYMGGPRNLGKAVRSHFVNISDSNRDKMKTPDRARMCVGSKVSICGRNFIPEWGLYNSAIGTVTEIHFTPQKENHKPNPNHGDLCTYVVVYFSGYKGPIWDPANPKHVPIPIIKERCSKMCCVKEFIPLELAFATTIHKVEGLTIGPSNTNSDTNASECMIVDVGSRLFESNCPGIFYTAYSRATTDGDGDPSKSAIFFMGNNITEKRLISMTKKKDKEKNLRVIRRDHWIKWIKKHTKKSGISNDEKKILFEWATFEKIDKERLTEHIAKSGYRSCVH